MKTKLLFFLLSFYCIGEAQVINFPDANLKTKLLSLDIDTNNNSEIEVGEAQVTTYLDISNSNISDLSGIENFTNLTVLRCRVNQLTSLLPLASLTNLGLLDCGSNQLTSLAGIEDLHNFSTMNCSNNQLTSLSEINIGSNLYNLDCSNNLLTAIDFGLLPPSLQYFKGAHNQLTSLDVGMHEGLSVKCSHNQISNVILPATLSELDISYNLMTTLVLDTYHI